MCARYHLKRGLGLKSLLIIETTHLTICIGSPSVETGQENASYELSLLYADFGVLLNVEICGIAATLFQLWCHLSIQLPSMLISPL